MEQVAEIYAAAGPGGTCGLRRAFFDDLRVADAGHRRLFQEWFRRCCLPPGDQEGPPAAERLAPGARAAAEAPRGPPPPAAPGGPAGRPRPSAGCPSREAPAGGGFRGWLLEADASGELARAYLEVAEAHYDTPEQVVRLYTSAATPATWSPLFFEDLGVREAHRPAFSDWLAAHRGASTPRQTMAPEIDLEKLLRQGVSSGVASGVSLSKALLSEREWPEACDAATPRRCRRGHSRW